MLHGPFAQAHKDLKVTSESGREGCVRVPLDLGVFGGGEGLELLANGNEVLAAVGVDRVWAAIREDVSPEGEGEGVGVGGVQYFPVTGPSDCAVEHQNPPFVDNSVGPFG